MPSPNSQGLRKFHSKNLNVTDFTNLTHTHWVLKVQTVTSGWATFLQSVFKNPTNHTIVPPHKETCALICKEIPESTAQKFL